MFVKTKLALATIATAAMLAGGALTAAPALAAPPHAGGGDEIWMRGGHHGAMGMNRGAMGMNRGNFAMNRGRFDRGSVAMSGNWNHHGWDHRGWDHHGDWSGGGFGIGLGFGGPYYGYDGYYGDYAYDYGPSYYYSAPAYAYNDANAYCASRFRSYNPVTHTYTGYDGLQHPCP